MSLLPEGLPPMPDYERLVGSDLLSDMASYATRFHAGDDPRRSSPLEQWSRRWEYPFAFEAIADHVARVGAGDGGTQARVLDAGSGFTFFPFFVAERLDVTVTCVDAAALATSFLRVAEEARVRFVQADVTALAEHPDASFEAASCVSVLEHLRDRAAVLAELRRVLVPGGLLVLTFDVALDGDYEVPMAEAESILEAAAGEFDGEALSRRDGLRDALRGDVLTTRRIAAREPWRMPWNGRLRATLGSFRHGFVPRSVGYRNLTVWCGRLIVPDGDAHPAKSA